ncbi:MAG: hypothetical protein J6B90_07885 [Lachnospiraceae bacterium]|nr:hypothetical protein [Lachnospiraceae bacterium]
MRDCRRQLSQVIEDDFVDSLQKSVQSIKKNRELEVHFMGWHEMLRDERAEDKAEGKAEDVLELLQELGEVSEELHSKVMGELNLEVLKRWHKLAAKADTIEQFLENM